MTSVSEGETSQQTQRGTWLAELSRLVTVKFISEVGYPPLLVRPPGSEEGGVTALIQSDDAGRGGGTMMTVRPVTECPARGPSGPR